MQFLSSFIQNHRNSVFSYSLWCNVGTLSYRAPGLLLVYTPALNNKSNMIPTLVVLAACVVASPFKLVLRSCQLQTVRCKNVMSFVKMILSRADFSLGCGITVQGDDVVRYFLHKEHGYSTCTASNTVHVAISTLNCLPMGFVRIKWF